MDWIKNSERMFGPAKDVRSFRDMIPIPYRQAGFSIYRKWCPVPDVTARLNSQNRRRIFYTEAIFRYMWSVDSYQDRR